MKRMITKVKKKIIGIPTGDTYHNEKAKSYEKTRSKTLVWQNEQKHMQFILSDLEDEIQVLDVPFGTGRYVPLYLQKSMEIYGLDSSSDMIEVAKNKLGKDFELCQVEVGDATRTLPYKDNMFDLVVVSRFLQGTVNFGKVLKILDELVRVSKKHVIMTLSERSKFLPRFKKPNLSKKMSNQLYAKEIKDLLNEKGLKVVNVGSLHHRYISTHCMYLCEKTE